MKCSNCPNELIRGNHFNGSSRCHECSLSSAYDTIDSLQSRCERLESELAMVADESRLRMARVIVLEAALRDIRDNHAEKDGCEDRDEIWRKCNEALSGGGQS